MTVCVCGCSRRKRRELATCVLRSTPVPILRGTSVSSLLQAVPQFPPSCLLLLSKRSKIMQSDTDVARKAISGRMGRMDWKSRGGPILRAPSVPIIIISHLRPRSTPACHFITSQSTVFKRYQHCKDTVFQGPFSIFQFNSITGSCWHSKPPNRVSQSQLPPTQCFFF